jgi:flavin reductase (DIM6/NTAB) family NADH-FMN oxidoreductase RutF
MMDTIRPLKVTRRAMEWDDSAYPTSWLEEVPIGTNQSPMNVDTFPEGEGDVEKDPGGVLHPEEAAALFRGLDRELWLVTASTGERRGGLIATFVSQASLVPGFPRVILGLAKQHHTWGLIEASGAFAMHLIGETQLDRVWRFGLQSGRDHDKLSGLVTRPGVSGAPILADAPGWLDCRVEARLDTGDRTVYLAEVLDAQAPGWPFLTVSRLRSLVPDDRRLTLEEQMTRDIAIDARAIAAWRRGGE